jgi:hypothetical protein
MMAVAQNATASTPSTSQSPQTGRPNRLKTAAAASSCGTQNTVAAAGVGARAEKSAEMSEMSIPNPSAAAEDSSMVRNVGP